MGQVGEEDSGSDENFENNDDNDSNSSKGDGDEVDFTMHSQYARNSELVRNTAVVGLNYLEFYEETQFFLQSIRYIQPRYRIPKATTVEEWFHQPILDDPRIFRVFFRMDRSSFEFLVSILQTNPVFHNDANFQQKLVQYQLAVFLFRLGGKGGGDTNLVSGIMLGIAEGTISLYVQRVLTAILNLKSQYIKWPSAEERDIHKRRVCSESLGVFPGCVGFVDGTFLTLKYAPLKDWFCYFNRKGTYALNAMVVCTDRGQIVYIRAGDTSAVHDARVFENSQLSINPERFFSPNEYLIGDSAYTCNNRMVTPFKKPRALDPDCRQFNATLSSRRTVIEHVFGILKARFPSITSISIRITGIATHKRVVDWFEAACILHNFLLDLQDDSWDINQVENEDTVQENQELVDIEMREYMEERRGRNREDHIREALLRHMRNLV